MPDDFGYPLPGEPGWPGHLPQFALGVRNGGGQVQPGAIKLVGNLGRSVVLSPDAASQRDAYGDALVPFVDGTPSKATLVNAQASDPADPQAEVSTVMSCSLSVPPLILDPTSPLANSQKFLVSNGVGSPPNVYLTRPQALVEWGAGGVTNQALLDYANGFGFSVPASWMRVTAINQAIPQVIGDGVTQLGFGRGVTLGANVGMGSLSKSNTFNAKVTVYEDNYNNAADSLYFVPAYASNLLVYYRPNSPLASLAINFYDDAGIFMYSADFPSDGSQDVPVELSGDIEYVGIGAGAGLPNGSLVRFVFGLSI